MHSIIKLGVVTGAVIAAVTTVAGIGSAAPKATPTPTPGYPPAPQGGVTIALKNGTLDWDCPLTHQQRPFCHAFTGLVSATFVEGFVIVTRENGGRLAIPRERLIALTDVPTLVEKPPSP